LSQNLNHQQLIDWLRLFRTENIGPATFRKLLNKYGSASAALDALPYLSSRGGRNAPLKAPSIDDVESEIEQIENIGARIITSADDDFPPLLKHIAASPPILSIIGGDIINSENTVAIVGSRNASAAGNRMANILATDLADAGYIIVSGLARGIDASAHKASVLSGTIAVLAGGLDNIYPSENIPLAKEIVENGGLLISEMPLGYQAKARDFPRRNRLVSGISKGIVIVEAAKRSGSLITARLALEQNREVFAVPGSPLDPRSNGTNNLIQQGATLVINANDIIDVLDSARPNQAMLFEDEDSIDFSYIADNENDNPSSDERIRLISALSVTPVSVDEIIQQTNISTLVIQTLLLELDIAGRIEWASGQLVCLKQ